MHTLSNSFTEQLLALASFNFFLTFLPNLLPRFQSVPNSAYSKVKTARPPFNSFPSNHHSLSLFLSLSRFAAPRLAPTQGIYLQPLNILTNLR